MPNIMELMKHLKQQTGKRYRLIRMDSTNVSIKKSRGYAFVRGEDAEVKGTILADEHLGPDGIVKIGNLGLARISEADAQKREKELEERTESRLKLIKEGYLREGENIKRKLGSHHKEFEPFVEEEK